MGLKIAISGKGGVGKSTIAAMLAHLAASEGRRVLAVDADPDANLAAALGMPASQRTAIIPLAERRALIEERTGAKVKQYGQIFKLNPDVADIAEKESALYRGIHLLVLGAIESGGSGCACPENVLLRSLLQDVILYKDDCVILDFEAGLEHLGRATGRGVDLMLVVVEPGARSVETAWSVRRMASEIGVRQVAVVANKIASAEDHAFIERAFGDGDGDGGGDWAGALLGELPYAETFRRADRDGMALYDLADQALRTRFDELWTRIKARAAG